MTSAVMIGLLFVAWTAFFWSVQRRFRLMATGKPAMRWDDLPGRIGDTLLYAFGQRRMPRYPLTGYLHIAIFFGFLVLLVRSIVLWGRAAYDPAFNLDPFFGPLGQPNEIGVAYSFVKDVFVIVVLVAAGAALYNRVVNKPARLTQSFEANLILTIIFVMMLGDLLYDGAHLALHGGAAASLETHWYEFGGLGAMSVIGGLGVERPATLSVLAEVGFWTHSVLVLLFLNLLPYGKHFHVVTSFPNVFLRTRGPAGRLPPIEDLEQKMEEMGEDERFGLGEVTDLTWKHLLDLYTCTECGRCTDQCPANNTGKLLSPKHISIFLRNNLYGRERELLHEEPSEPVGRRSEEAPTTEVARYGHAGYEVPASRELLPEVVPPEMLWACTTCRACEVECPVFISYVDKIVGMRQHLVLDQGEVPPELATALRGMETNSNPWNISAMDRAKWTAGLEVPVLGEMEPEQAKAVDYLLFVGCAASFDDRAKKVARSMVRLLDEAGVSYAILGEEEQCNGDIARRAGNEYLFQVMAKMLIETFAGYDVKKIVTICPHCFNTFKNEYPDFGGNYEVLTHVELLLDLVGQGKLKPSKRVETTCVYHDSCYLGRHNDIYDAPRALLGAIPGVQLVEAERSRDRGMCCGAGGAQYFKEEEEGKERVNVRRIAQLLETRPETIASACPFCMTMLTDGLKAKDKEEEVAQVDLAELLARSCGLEEAKAQAEDS